ncbi:MAG: hypothetical protein Alpg2KO_15560 [Alphaproteobacteria bacterium]
MQPQSFEYRQWMPVRPVLLLLVGLALTAGSVLAFNAAQADGDGVVQIISVFGGLMFGAMIPAFLLLPLRVSVADHQVRILRLFGKRHIPLQQVYRLTSTTVNAGGGQILIGFDWIDDQGHLHSTNMATGTGSGERLVPKLLEAYEQARPGQMDHGAIGVMGSVVQAWQVPTEAGWTRHLPMPHTPGFNMRKFWVLFILATVLTLGGLALGWYALTIGHEDWPLAFIIALVVGGISAWQGRRSWFNRLKLTEAGLQGHGKQYIWQEITSIRAEGDDLILDIAGQGEQRWPVPTTSIPTELVAKQLAAMLPKRRKGW